MVLLAHIREQHKLSLGSYGRPRMTEELRELGFDVGHRRPSRGLHANPCREGDSNHKFNIAPNLLNRDFSADQPNQKWPFGDCMQSPVG